MPWKTRLENLRQTAGAPPGLSELASLYHPTRRDDLLVFLGSTGSKLDWKSLWDTGHGPEWARNLWLHASRLPPESEARAKQKLDRFLRGLDPWFPKVVEIPTDNDDVVTAI
jgi:hypothetical protein